jgi:hypothetical protein
MKEQFTAAQISRIIDQALIYQCACPAQVGRAIFEMRELYQYQMGCANNTSNDERVHVAIARATEESHKIMEACLREILEIEGWEMGSLALPESLKNKTVKSV